MQTNMPQTLAPGVCYSCCRRQPETWRNQPPSLHPQDGKAIISGWSDGKVRAFGPQSGKLLYAINDAHHKAVTALAVTPDPGRILTGGEEGEL